MGEPVRAKGVDFRSHMSLCDQGGPFLTGSALPPAVLGQVGWGGPGDPGCSQLPERDCSASVCGTRTSTRGLKSISSTRTRALSLLSLPPSLSLSLFLSSVLKNCHCLFCFHRNKMQVFFGLFVLLLFCDLKRPVPLKNLIRSTQSLVAGNTLIV